MANTRSSPPLSMTEPTIQLNKGEDRRLRAGHLWIFSNEVNVKLTPLSAFAPGDQAVVVSHSGETLGRAYVNPQSLICARLISRKFEGRLDFHLLYGRLKQALAMRNAIYTEPYYRLAFGESDGLPGLVVDRYDSILIVQITTAGMEQQRSAVISALLELLTPAGILFKNDAPMRALEGLPSYVEVVHGEIPAECVISENGAQFRVPLLEGQKTGWFFDQRLNRLRMQTYAKGARVLDVFSYVGGWAILAAISGAESVICIDASARALRYLHENAEINDCVAKITTLEDDAFVALRQIYQNARKFDLIILDPPAFIKRKKDLKEGLLAYQRLNMAAMQILAPGGILISASCSHHLPAMALLDVLRRSSLRTGVEMQVLEQGHQAPDHPIHPAIPETEYLKTFICRNLG